MLSDALMELSKEHRDLNQKDIITLYNRERDKVLSSKHNLKDSITSLISHVLTILDIEI